MVLFFPKETHQSLVFLDTEFNDRKLIQVAMITYERMIIDTIPVYVLKGSVNIYINNEINYFFTRYTGINYDFLQQHGIPETDAAEVLNGFLDGLRDENTLYIAHGIKQDLELLQNMGIDLGTSERYCTYNNSKTLLGRDKNLKLIDVCNESGYYSDQHDAYTDAKNVVHAFSYLKLVEAAAR
jgi:hypothetical protein